MRSVVDIRSRAEKYTGHANADNCHWPFRHVEVVFEN